MLLGRECQLSCFVYSGVSLSAERHDDWQLDVQVCLGHERGALEEWWGARQSCSGKVVQRVHASQRPQSGCLTMPIS